MPTIMKQKVLQKQLIKNSKKKKLFLMLRKMRKKKMRAKIQQLDQMMMKTTLTTMGKKIVMGRRIGRVKMLKLKRRVMLVKARLCLLEI